MNNAKTIQNLRATLMGWLLIGILFALAGDQAQAAFANNAGRIWVGVAADNSFSAASSSSWIPGSVPTTNNDLWIGTSTASGGTNVISTGTAATKSIMACHGMTFFNNFNSSNSIIIGATGLFPIGTAMGTNAPVPSYIETLMTSGTVRFQTTDPANPASGTLSIRLGTNMVISTAAGSTIQIACLIEQTNWAGVGNYTVPYSITKTNSGTLSLLNSNGFNGGVTLYGGTLNVGNSNALGASSGTFTIYGGSLDNVSGVVLTNINYPVSVNGDFTFIGSANLNLGAGAVTLSGTRQVTVTANTLTLGGVVGPSSGGNGLTKAGSGTLALNGSDTYNGNTTISAGTLSLGASASIANSPNITANGVLDVSSVSGFALGGSQSLLGSGAVNGSVGTVSGSKIIPGTDGTTGTLTFSNGLTLASGATCNFDLGSTATGANDELVVLGTGTALTLNNNTFIIKAAATLDTIADYTLISAPNGSISGTFSSVPTWSGTPPANSSSYSIITSAHSVLLHYTPPTSSIDHFVVTPSTGSTTAGAVFAATVQAYNAANNPITDNSVDGTTVLMTSSGAAQFDANSDSVYGDNLKALTNGTFTINMIDLKAESITITATSGTNVNTSTSVTINAGAAAQLQVIMPGETATPGVAPGKTGAPTARTAGAGYTVTVNAVDTNYNVAASSDTVSLTAGNDAHAVLPANTALSGGTVTLSVTNMLAGGGRTLTASDVSNGGITAATSAGYVVVPGAATQLVLLAPGETATLGTAPGKAGSPGTEHSTVGYTVTADALDAAYNLVTNCTDTVHIASSTGGDTLPASAALAGGTKTFAVTNNTVGSTTLTVSDTSVGGVATGSTTVTVSINGTTTTLGSSANPASEGESITLTAAISGTGPKTGTVTFKNGASTLGTSTVSGGTAAFTLSGGAGTYSLTASYGGDANDSSSTSGTLSQVIQVNTNGVVGEAILLEDGQDYPTAGTTTSPTGRAPWLVAGGSGSSSFITIQAGDLSGATTPDVRPLPNQTTTPPTNPPAKLQLGKAGSAQRIYYRPLTNNTTSGSVYCSVLLNVTANPTLTDEIMGELLSSTGGGNNAANSDPLTLHARKGADTTHFDLGIERLNGTTVWTSDLADDTTYLIVLKYTFGSASTCSLYVNPTPGNSEPSPTASATSDGVTAEPSDIGTLQFWESSVSTSGTYQYDVMRADTVWSTVTPSINGSTGLGATKLALSPGPQILTVNSNSTPITITLLDQSNNVFTATANLTINLSSTSGGATFLASDDATVVSSVVITGGTSTATFYYRDSIAGNPTVTAANGLLTSATQAETINPPPGDLDHFVVTPSAGSASAGVIFTVTVQAYDSNNVAIVNSSLDGEIVTLGSSGLAQFDANGDGTYGDNLKALTNGALTINVRDLKAESLTITATLGTPSGTSSALTITPDALAQLQLLMPGETATPGVGPGKTGAPTARTAGVGYSVIVNGVDTNWNVTASSDTVNLAAVNDANAILPANTALVAGTKTLSVTNIIAGSGRTLTATDVSNGGITASTGAAYVVVANSAAQLVVLAPGELPSYGAAPGKTGTPSHQLQTGPFTLTVNALDAYYNLATSASDTVQITSSDVGATLPANAPLSAGIGSFSVAQAASGSVTDTATDVSNGGVASGSTTLTVDIIPRFRTMASGNWSSTSTWQYSTDGGATWNPATSTPSSSLTALAEITNGVTVTVNSTLSIDRTTVDAGGTVSVPGGTTLAVVPGTGIDLDVYGTIVNSGVLTNQSGNISFESGSLYNHAQDNGTLPSATWNANSTCDVTGWTASTSCSTAMGLGQRLGNFVWNSPGMTANLSLGNSKFSSMGGSFEVLSTGSGVLNVVEGGSLTNTIDGNVIVTGGNLDLDKGAGTIQFTVGGNVSVSSGAFLDATPTTSGSATVAFITAGKHTLSNSGTISGLLKWVVYSNTVLDVGTSVIGSTNSFAVNPGAGVITAKATGLAGNLAIPTNNVSLSVAGDYTYDGVTSQSGDTLLPAVVAGLIVNNSSGLTLHQATTATNLTLTASPVTGNLTVPDIGAMLVSGGGCSVTGNLNLGASSLTLVSSNNFPELTIITGTMNMSGGVEALVVQGAALGEGTNLLVGTASGGTVSGTPAALVNLSGTALPVGATGVPQIAGGKLYMYYQKFFGAVDNGPGFFSGENLQHDDLSGRTFYVWSTSDLTQPVSNWTFEGPTVEFPISGSSPAMSHYGITVTPSASPMYYVIVQTNIGPFSATEPLITLTTSDYVDFNVGVTNTLITSGGVFELVQPVITPVQINTASLHLSGGTMAFTFTNATGLTFTILATNNIAAPAATWPAIGTATESPTGSGNYQFSDPAAGSQPQRFYLLRQP